ncbi:MAG TPA: serine/threonine-protein kinase [Polyangiaceae bacterium]|nr:serine/threonine-protein kinase [Polyangiaceae bacterium]
MASPPPEHLIISSNRARVGRYRLVARLGSGGMADVYLAMASGMVGFTKLSVVKVLKPEFAHDGEHVAMFLDEARLAARLNHPNVVQTNEVGEDQGLYYLVMEYLEGQVLRRVLQLSNSSEGGRLLPTFLQIISDMLAGLHHAHELCDFDGRPLGVVHRDVSPHNVFVTYDGQTKVVDFGIAKAAGSSHLTRAGMIKGKIAYMAPEQARGQNVDRRADIFPAGVILWEAIARRRMWEGEQDLGILQRLATGDLPSIREHAPGAPEELLQICERALAIDPSARYATAQEMREALEAFLHASHRRVTSSDIAGLMNASFREQRAAIRAVIESSTAAGTGSHTLPWLPNQSGMLPEHPSRSYDSAMRPSSYSLRLPSADSASLAGAGSFHSSTGTSRQGLHKPPALRLLAPGLAVALLSSGGVYWAHHQRIEPPRAPAQSAASVASPPAAADVASAAAPPPESVELRVRVTPSSATIYLDDAELKGNPFHGLFPRNGRHIVRAEAPGYQTTSQAVNFQRDVTLEITLVRQPTSSPPRPAPPPPPARPRPQPPRPAGQSTAAPETNFDLPQPPANKRPVQPIDPESPYLERGAPLRWAYSGAAAAEISYQSLAFGTHARAHRSGVGHKVTSATGRAAQPIGARQVHPSTTLFRGPWSREHNPAVAAEIGGVRAPKGRCARQASFLYCEEALPK